jgi:hypothetical protein
MPIYKVEVPIRGTAYIEVEAENVHPVTIIMHHMAKPLLINVLELLANNVTQSMVQ